MNFYNRLNYDYHFIIKPTKKSFHRSGGIPVEFQWSHKKLQENDWNKWNLWNSFEIPLDNTIQPNI